jgi:hypothetical protein
LLDGLAIERPVGVQWGVDRALELTPRDERLLATRAIVSRMP